MLEKEFAQALLQLREKQEALGEWVSGLEARNSATRMALIYALAEATKDTPNREAMLRAVCDRLEAPGASYEGLDEFQQKTQMQSEYECAQLSHAMRLFLGL